MRRCILRQSHCERVQGVEGTALPDAEKAEGCARHPADDEGQHSFEATQDGRRNRSLPKRRAAPSTNPGVAYLQIAPFSTTRDACKRSFPRATRRSWPTRPRPMPTSSRDRRCRRREDREWQDGTAGWCCAGVAKYLEPDPRFACDRRQGDVDLGRPDHRDDLSEAEAKPNPPPPHLTRVLPRIPAPTILEATRAVASALSVPPDPDLPRASSVASNGS